MLAVNNLSGSHVKIVAPSEKEYMPKIAEFFISAQNNYRLFNLGISAINANRLDFFDSGKSIMPVFSNYLTDEHYNEAWKRVTSKLKKGDMICTFNSKSLISKTIARIDKGSWSHCGVYVGNNEIFEMISKGAVRRNIDAYKQKYIHFGIYRPIGSVYQMNMENDDYINHFIELSKNDKYSYLKALILGIRTILSFTDGKFSPVDVTPNAIIYKGGLDLPLIDYV